MLDCWNIQDAPLSVLCRLLMSRRAELRHFPGMAAGDLRRTLRDDICHLEGEIHYRVSDPARVPDALVDALLLVVDVGTLDAALRLHRGAGQPHTELRRGPASP